MARLFGSFAAMRRLITIFALWLLAGTWACIAAQPTDRVKDLKLAVTDIQTREVQPFLPAGQICSVIIFTLTDCPIANQYAPEIQRIVAAYDSKKVRFYLAYPDPDLKSDDIKKHVKEFGYKGIVPLHDAQLRLARVTGATVTPEAVVVLDDGRIAYRGRIDDRVVELGKIRQQPNERDLRAALDSILSGKPVLKSRTEAIGCYIAEQKKL